MLFVAQQILPINSLLQPRKLSVQGHCPICFEGEETVMHALRDCVRTKKVWEFLVSPNLLEEFYSFTDCSSWVNLNLHKRWRRGSQNDEWKYIFRKAVQAIWMRRNSFVFDPLYSFLSTEALARLIKGRTPDLVQALQL